MRRINQSVFSLIIAIALISCSGSTEKKVEETTEAEPSNEVAEARSINVNLNESNVRWSGSVIGMHSHYGDISITEGILEMSGDMITGGNFTIDMTSITPTDSGYSEDKTPDMLVGHLSSGDFFLVDSFPTANFVIKSADMSNGTVTGDLTVRGITNEETIENVSLDSESGTANGELTIDRQAYDVAFKHPLKDVVISDNIELEISLKL